MQSALSHNLSQLEEELSSQLFHRRPRGVELTATGKILYQYAQSVLSTIDRAAHEISREDPTIRQQIWIGMNHTATRLSLPKLPLKLGDEFPEIKFGFVEDISSTLVEHVIEERAHLAIVCNPPASSLTHLPVLREEVCCIGTQELLGETEEPIRFADVLSLPLILAGQGKTLSGIVASADLAKQLESACVMEINSMSALVSVLSEGLGCTLLSRATVSKELDQKSLVARRIEEPEISRDLTIVYSARSPESCVLSELASRVHARIQESVVSRKIRGVELL